jgi:hypothetical protein
MPVARPSSSAMLRPITVTNTAVVKEGGERFSARVHVSVLPYGPPREGRPLPCPNRGRAALLPGRGFSPRLPPHSSDG